MVEKRERIYGIDSIRAFAALSVVLAHILGPVIPNMLRSLPINLGRNADFSIYIFTGHPAVIVFFVVSGFCIHYPYVNGTLSVLPFLAARFTRIMLPSLIAIGFAKLVKVSSYNYWDGYILWSIVCELFYYSLYPFFMIASRFVPWRLQFYLAFGVSCVLVIILGSDRYGSAHIYGPYLNWLIALPSWLAGCVLAERVVAGRYPTNANNIYLWRIAVALTASILYWLTLNTRVGYYLTMNAFSLLVFLWLGVEISAARNRRVSFFEWMGKWSFSIYLFHMIIFIQLGRMFRLEWWGWRLLVISVVLLLCYAAYYIIEQPSHKIARMLFTKLRQRSNKFLVRAY
jgi:peptidoglycan/LPS O-acetylase OafA/YrhL